MNKQNESSPKDLELQVNAKRAITTAFIGALAEFEKEFGYIWAKDKKGIELTQSEQYFWDKYQVVRKKILDIGNEQCRIIDREFDKFIIKYVGHYIEVNFNHRRRNGQ